MRSLRGAISPRCDLRGLQVTEKERTVWTPHPEPVACSVAREKEALKSGANEAADLAI